LLAVYLKQLAGRADKDNMQRAMVSALLFVLLFVPAWGKGRGSRSNSTKCVTCTRNSRGRIKRSPEARRAFEKSNPCPSTGKRSGGCPGYVVDHVVPLKKGGADTSSNMQWQTKSAAKAKDRIE
jgi:hypothetical protein